MDNSLNLTRVVVDRLLSIDETCLSVWFVDNYIQACSRLTPRSISQLFDDISTSMKLQNAVSSVVAWGRNNNHSWTCGECFILQSFILQRMYALTS